MKKQICNLYRKTCAKRVHTKVTHFMLAAFSVLVLFSSCSNAFLDGGSASGVKTGTVTGSLDFGGALPKEILDQLNSSSKNSGPQGERTAFPRNLTASSVEVYAQIGSDTDTRVVASADLETKKYLIGNLTYGKEYTITAKFMNDSEKVIMQGSVKVTLSDDEPVVNKNISVAPTQTENGEGSIILYFSVNEDVGWSSNDVVWSYVLDNDNEQPMGNVSIGGNTFNKDPIPSGAHSVKFIFKQKNTYYILYQFTETINVFDNLMTNKWVKNGNEPYFTISESCQITKECVDKFAQKTFYVDSSRQTTNSSGAGYTTQSGTYFNPFVKVSDAVNRINAGSNADYTIYVKDGHSEDFEGIEINKNISIETYKDTPGDGLGNATLKMQDETSTFLWIDSNTKFSLKNFILDGNSVKISSDGGIIANSGNTTLINCELKNGKSGARGGAICNATEASITLEKCNIHDCSSASSDDGGGIYNTGIITIKETVISGCTAGDPMNSSYCDGGGIYNNGTLTLTDCTISGNEAKNGGGIYNAGNLAFKGKCVIGDESKTTTATSADCSNKATSNGGGLYLASPFTVDSGSKLYVCQNCTTLDGNGGGVYVKLPSSSQTLNDVVVKYCSATNGGGIYVSESNYLKISDSKILNCKGSNDGTGLYLGSNSTILENTCVENCNELYSGFGYNGGVYCTDTIIQIKGTTYIDAVLYVAGSATIKVTDTLTPKDQNGVAKDKVATIRPESYVVGNQVLYGNAVATEYFKFAVKQNPNTSDIYWRVNKSGFLDTKIGTKAPGEYAVGDIVFNDGSATPYSEIESTGLTEAEKNAAIAVIFRVGDGSDGNKTLGVGIKHETTACFASSSKGCSINFTNTVCVPDSGTDHGSFTFFNSENTDGSQNLKKMIDAGANDTGIIFNEDETVNFESSNQTTLATNYPAFEFAYYYGKNGHNIISESEYETGWYLPSVSELNDIYLENNSTNIIQKALIAAGGIDFNNKNYLTSTQECASGYTNCVTGFYINTGSKNYIGKNTNDNIRYACAIRAFN